MSNTDAELQSNKSVQHAFVVEQLIEKKRFERALSLIDEILSKQPRNDYLKILRGVCHCELSQESKIEEYVQTLSKSGEASKALNYLQELIRRFPNNAKFLQMLDVTMCDAFDQIGDVTKFHETLERVLNQGKMESGLAIINNAIERHPNDSKLLFYKATWCKNNLCINEAITFFQKAVSIRPDFDDAWFNLANEFSKRGLNLKAIETYDKISHTNIGNINIQSNRLFEYLKSPHSTNEILLDVHTKWASSYANPIPSCRPFQFSDSKWRFPLRIGIHCSFWDADTIRYQFLSSMVYHNRELFHLIGYSEHVPTKEMINVLDEVYNVKDFTDEKYVEKVRSDRVHILIELNGFSPSHRFVAMATRCAPIQVSYLNYTSTCGVPAVDFILTDKVALPEGTDHFFTEKIYRMENCFFCFDYSQAKLPEVTPPPCLKNKYTTFGCFGSGSKINPKLVELWAKVLKKVPHSKIFIRNKELDSQDNREFLADLFKKQGISDEQLIITEGASRDKILESYGDVDISLDTFPYCGGNTIAESLWQGVPVITLSGKRFSENYGASLLSASGLSSLIATTPDEYAQIAYDLANDVERLKKYRFELRKMVVEYGFGNGRDFMRRFEDAMLGMIKQTNPSWHESIIRTKLPANFDLYDANDPADMLARVLLDKEPRLRTNILKGEWASRFAKPQHEAFHRQLIEIGMRGLGISNETNEKLTGENWFIETWSDIHKNTPSLTTFDVGANVGEYTQAISKACPRAKIYSFEPSPISFAEFLENTRGLNCEAHNLALGEKKGVLNLYDYSKEESAGSVHASFYPEVFSFFYKESAKPTPVNVTTIDEFCSEKNILRIDLLKIDTEGGELKVLKGASRMIREGRIGTIQFEFNQNNIFSRTFFYDFVNLLPGYDFGRLLPNSILPIDSSDGFINNLFDFQNIIAFPRQ